MVLAANVPEVDSPSDGHLIPTTLGRQFLKSHQNKGGSMRQSEEAKMYAQLISDLKR